MKADLSLDELRQMALAKIREHRGCHDVEDVSVCPIANAEPDPNWAISCGVGGSDKAAAAKAALYVEQELQEQVSAAEPRLVPALFRLRHQLLDRLGGLPFCLQQEIFAALQRSGAGDRDGVLEADTETPRQKHLWPLDRLLGAATL